jgi:vancomycin resistance protein YoaR
LSESAKTARGAANIPFLATQARAAVLRGRRASAGSRLLWEWAIVTALLAASVAALVGVVFAGSSARIAEGVRIAGVDVGGLTAAQARARLERRADALQGVPAPFIAFDERWRMTPRHLGVEADWAAAVQAAQRQSAGFGPFRGLRRFKVRVFGADIAPPVKVYEPALDYELGRMAKAIDRRPREPAVVLKGLAPILVRGRAGRTLRREAAAAVIVGTLAGLTRTPAVLPVATKAPRIETESLRPALRQARVALSAPVRIELGKTWWRLPRWRIAELLALPRDGSQRLEIGGAGAERWFRRFARTVGRPATNARFVAAAGGSVGILPHRDGLALERDATEVSLRTAMLSRTKRVARVTVETSAPTLTTSEARALGITSVLASYSTFYAGTPDRIRNLQLAISLLDGTVVPPGATFSLNRVVGERTSERGFRVAPVIIDGEYEDAVGGGVSQVATTVFNAAWEAGLKIVERAPHALYISRYPDGRDATVNYPDLDLKFLNDTGRTLVVLGRSGSDGINVTVAGAPTGRRVVSEPGQLEVTGPVPIKRIEDPTRYVGQTVVEEEGSLPRSITVKRTVYDRDGTVLYDETWRTNYRGEKRVLRVGTKIPEPKPEPPTEPEPKPKPEPGAKEPPAQPKQPKPPAEVPPPDEIIPLP